MLISGKKYLLATTVRMRVLRLAGLCLVAIVLASPAVAGKKKPKIVSVSDDPIYMDRATFGDVIGLQPGFERFIEPSAGPADAMVQQPETWDTQSPSAPPLSPARVIKAAVQPMLPVIKPEAQFVQRVQAPPFNVSLKALERPKALLGSADKKQIKTRQKELARQRAFAAKELKASRDITVASVPRDVLAIKSIAAEFSARDAEKTAMRTQLAQAQSIALERLERPTSLAPALNPQIPTVSVAALERGVSSIAEGAKSLQAALLEPIQTIEIAALKRPISVFETQETPKRTVMAAIKSGHTNAQLTTQQVATFDIRLVPLMRPESLVPKPDPLPALVRKQLATLPKTKNPLADYNAQIVRSAAANADNDISVQQKRTANPPSDAAAKITLAGIGAWQGLVGETTQTAQSASIVESAPIAAEQLKEPAKVASAESTALESLRAGAGETAPSIEATPQTLQQDFLTREQSLDVIDMVGLPGEAKLLNVPNEDRGSIVASVKTTSTKYEARPIGQGGLETLRDAVEHAIATNPDVKIAEAQQEDAFYAVREARSGFLPKVDINAGGGPEVSRQSGNEEITRIRRELNATLRQTVFDFGLTQFDYRRAKQNYESAKLEKLQSVEDLTYEVTTAYLGVLQQQKVVALAHQNLEAHEYILNLVTAQKEAGQGTAADVNRVASSLSNAESFMLEEESKLQQARDQYRRLLDAPPGLLVDPLLDLSLLPQSPQDAADRSVEESPRLLQVKADTKSIRNQLRSHRGNFLPKVEVEVQGNLRTDVAGETGETRDARAMMFLRYNAFNGGADSAVSARLRARIKEIGFEFEKQRREVEQNIRNDFTAIDASRAKVDTIRDQVDAAKEVVRLYEEQFRAGDRTAFDLLDAQQALINAKLEQVLNSYQENRAAFRVLQQLGSLYYALTSDE
ncbi:MAG: TolC family outer membrane protein [Pseudomonadota bacterium]